MTQPGIEPRSPRPLANTLPTRPMSRFEDIIVCKWSALVIRNHEITCKKKEAQFWYQVNQ